METVMITLQQIMILALEIGVGYAAAKTGKLSQNTVGVLNFLCCCLALPCSIVYSVIHLENSAEVWYGLSKSLFLILMITILQAAASLLMFRGTAPGKRAVLRMGTFSSNTAFMGIPLVTAIIGSDAVIYATCMVILDTVILFTGASLAGSAKRLTAADILKKLFGTATISMLTGLVILFSGISLPAVITTCISDFKGMMTPLAMLIVGSQLARQKAGAIFTVPACYQAAFVKLLAAPALAALLIILLPFRIPAAAAAAIVICKATPQAAVLGVVAAGNGLDEECAASIVGLTTILSAVTLPLIAGAAALLFSVS